MSDISRLAGLKGLCLFILVAVFGCTSPPPAVTPPAEPDRIVLNPVEFASLPGWQGDSYEEVLPALRRSCQHFTDLPAGQLIGENGTGGTAGDWLGPCGALRGVSERSRPALRRYFESWFQPYLVSNGNRSSGLFTGYFEIELKGSRQRHGIYQTPIYGRPAGLSNAPGAAPGPTRTEIETRGIDAPVLLWVDDPIDAHILHIQGSGRVVLDNGEMVQIGYAGSNGQTYRALGRILLDHGLITPGDVTMQTIRAYLKAHPAEATSLMRENPRFIFFRVLSGDGPVGTAGVPLTPGRSLAVDTKFIPLGLPLWLDSADPDGHPLRRLMIAQDSGAAIKGPVRGDVFWGPGAAAFDLAGRMKSQGSYYVLLPRQRSGAIALGSPGTRR